MADLSGDCDGFRDGSFGQEGRISRQIFVADLLACVFLGKKTDFMTDFSSL